jgi:flavin reductase (DIM6/NTAB) family NADH-FMN oxidoreductase RutF
LSGGRGGDAQGGAAVNEVAALFRRLTVGVYVVGVAHEGRRGAFTAAWAMPASFDPPLLVLAASPRNASYPLLRAGGGFALSVLRQGQLELARRFGTRSGRDGDKLAGVDWQPARGGAPVLSDALAHFECELIECRPAGDHDLVVGRVVGGRVLDPTASPMSYAETGEMDGSAALFPSTLPGADPRP